METTKNKTKTENIRELCASVDKLIELEEKKIDTLRQLKRTFDLALLVPEVMTTKARMWLVEGSSFEPWRGAVLFVAVGDGEPRQFDLVKDNVPHSLWKPDLLVRYLRKKAQAERIREQRKSYNPTR